MTTRTRAEEDRDAAGMTEHSRRVLGLLTRDPRGVREIAHRLQPERGEQHNAHRGGVSRALDRLVERGLAERRRLPIGTGYVVTDEGEAYRRHA